MKNGNVDPDTAIGCEDGNPRTGGLLRWLVVALAIWLLIVGMYATYGWPSRRDVRGPLALAFSLQIGVGGNAQVFYDRGAGFRESDSCTLAIEPAPTPHPLLFPLGVGTLKRLRIDPLNGSDAAFTLHDPCLVEASTGRRVMEIALERMRPNEAIAVLDVEGRSVSATPQRGAIDPFLVVTLEPAVANGPGVWQRVVESLPVALGWYVALFGTLVLASRVSRRLRETGERIVRAIRTGTIERPFTTLVGVAMLSVVVCCHPVIFGGRSLVSPDIGLPLLHPVAPDFGYDATRASDTGAMLWQHLPYSVVQARALLDEHTLPLWNRFNSCGVPLLGQGQSMLGDPFHLPVVLARGANWAWDSKFVVARFLFACGVGWSVFLATRSLGASALSAFAAPYMGFFSFRWDHPAVISLCYAPWILVGWFGIAGAAQERAAARWLAVLFVATWCEATSGTVKEASMLAAGLNLAGVIVTLVTPRSRELSRFIWGSLGLLATAGLLLGAPIWMTFMDTLAVSMTSSDSSPVLRLPLARLAGLFDGMVYSEYNPGREVVAPSANVVVLVGCLCFLAEPRRWRACPMAGVCLAGAFGSLSLAFEVPWLPSAWIATIPGLRSIGHHYNVFSCVAIPLLYVVAAQGFAWFATAPGTARMRYLTLTAGGLMMLAWVSAIDLTSVWHTHGTPLRWAAWWLDHGIFLRNAVLLAAGSLVLLAAFHLLSRNPIAAGMLGLAAVVALLARHGQVMDTAHRDFFVVPQRRAALDTPTEGVAWLQDRVREEPARVLGMEGYLFPGFTNLHGLEGPNGPDALFSRHYRELVEAVGWARPNDWLLPLERGQAAAQRAILDLLNVRWLAVAPDMTPEPTWLRVAQTADFRVLENSGAWPRAYFCDSAAVAQTAADLAGLLRAGDGRPFIALESKNSSSAESDLPPPGRRVVAATDYRLGMNETAFSIAAPTAGWVALTEAWFPGVWAVTVDGRPATSLRVNHAFNGVRIESAGVHRIIFSYRPPRWTLSLFLCGAGFAMLGTLIYGSMRRSFAGGHLPPRP